MPDCVPRTQIVVCYPLLIGVSFDAVSMQPRRLNKRIWSPRIDLLRCEKWMTRLVCVFGWSLSVLVPALKVPHIFQGDRQHHNASRRGGRPWTNALYSSAMNSSREECIFAWSHDSAQVVWWPRSSSTTAWCEPWCGTQLSILCCSPHWQSRERIFCKSQQSVPPKGCNPVWSNDSANSLTISLGLMCAMSCFCSALPDAWVWDGHEVQGMSKREVVALLWWRNVPATFQILSPGNGVWLWCKRFKKYSTSLMTFKKFIISSECNLRLLGKL